MLANAQVPRFVLFRNEGIDRNRLGKVVVPGNITFGVELETFFPSRVNANMLNSTLASGGERAGGEVLVSEDVICKHIS